MKPRKNSKLSAWEKAKEYGVDTTLLELNLERSPTERVAALQDSILFANSLARAGERYNARLQKADKTSVRKRG